MLVSGIQSNLCVNSKGDGNGETLSRSVATLAPLDSPRIPLELRLLEHTDEYIEELSNRIR